MARAYAWLKRFAPPVRRRHGFVRDERGTTAIEFAILGIPFFAVIAAILETSLVFLAGQVLDSAVSNSSRIILTGQAQGSNLTAEQYRAAICDGLYGLFDCDLLRVNVSVIENFTNPMIGPAVDPENCDEDECEWTIPEAYDDGTGSSIILVQAYYRWPTILQFGGFNLQNLGDGTRLLAAVRVFRNEPFGTS